MALALDGQVHGNTSSGSLTVSLTTTSSNDVICIFVLSNGGPITSITVNGSNASLRVASGVAGNDIEEWRYTASSPLTAASIVINQTSAAFMTVNAIGISGANTSSPNDPNGSVPASSSAFPADPLGVTTSNANDFIVAAFRMNSTASPTNGAGWTLISGADYFLLEYQIVSSASTYSATIGTGVGDSNGGIVDAIVAASGATGIAVWPYRM